MKSVFMASLVCLFSLQANAVLVTSDANTYFSNLAAQTDSTQSLTNMWQLGWNNGSSFELFDYTAATVLGAGVEGWVQSGFFGAFVNTSGAAINYPGNILQPNQLLLHPGNTLNAEAILRFLVPEDGLYDLSAYFFAIDTIASPGRNSDGVTVSVEAAGATVGSTDAISGFGADRDHEVSQSAISLSQGDFVNFVVNPNNIFFDDGTLLTATMRFDDGTIPQLSSPSTFALFSLALLLLARNRISKKG
jgi:hypothetical protein